MSIYINRIILLAPPFNVGEITEDTNTSVIYDTDIEDELVLETPDILLSGIYLNKNTGRTSVYNSKSIQSNILGIGTNVIRNKSKLSFSGDVTIDFSSRYPIKTYSDIMKRTDLFVGEEIYGHQHGKAEIRYTLNGSKVYANDSNLYKKPIVIKRNMAGNDNVVIRYRLFYKGKHSKEGQLEFNIIKIRNNKVFYNL